MYNKETDECMYKGITYSSANKRAWAVFLDCTKNDWMYKPEVPQNLKAEGVRGSFFSDFYIRDVALNHWAQQNISGLWVDTTARRYAGDKIRKGEKYSGFGEYIEREQKKIPFILFTYLDSSYVDFRPDHWLNDIVEINLGNDRLYSFLYVDGDNYAAIPCITFDGQFQLSGPEHSYTSNVDNEATIRAYKLMYASLKMNSGISSAEDIEMYFDEIFALSDEDLEISKQGRLLNSEYRAIIQ